jgi:hypothetical protein
LRRAAHPFNIGLHRALQHRLGDRARESPSSLFCGKSVRAIPPSIIRFAGGPCKSIVAHLSDGRLAPAPIFHRLRRHGLAGSRGHSRLAGLLPDSVAQNCRACPLSGVRPAVLSMVSFGLRVRVV